MGAYSDDSGTYHGFIYNGTTYTTLDDPSGEPPNGSTASGISGGNIVGFYYDSTEESQGYLYNGATFTTLDDPLGVVASYVEGIDGNNITGAYRDELGDFHGFLTTVPEPSSVVLAVLGFLSLVSCCRLREGAQHFA